MNGWKNEKVTRLALMLVILLSGVALIPFIDLPVEAINWEMLAGAYEPSLDVDEDSGAPGSIFAFTGSGYPPLSTAFIYVDGGKVGWVMTDANGMATFTLNTTGAALGTYNVTLEVDANISATETIELTADDPIVMPPPNFVGPEFSLLPKSFLPIVRDDVGP
jgi:hypothetical protein